MTLGECLDNSIADGLVAFGIGLKRAAVFAAKVAEPLLNMFGPIDRRSRRFLTMGGADGKCGVCGSFGICYMPDRCPKSDEMLTEAEERDEVLGPWHSDGGPTEWLPGVTCLDQLSPTAHADFLTAADYEPGRAQHPLYREIQEQHDRDDLKSRFANRDANRAKQSTTLIEPRSEHPMYAQIQDCADAAVVAEVLSEHHPLEDFSRAHARIYCRSGDGRVHTEFTSRKQWRDHVAELIVAELQK